MNKKYFLIVLVITLGFSQTEVNPPRSNGNSDPSNREIEEEKNTEKENLYNIINRNIKLYYFDIAISKSIPLGTNINNNFNSGSSISMLIKTPYKTPKILNQFIFNIELEAYIKSFTPKNEGGYNSNYNILGSYLLLNTTYFNINLKYGLGFAHISPYNSLVPGLKLKLEKELDFNKAYSFLINNYILNENKEIRSFFDKLNISLGVAPELLLGFPKRKDEMTLSVDFYFKINLFNL